MIEKCHTQNPGEQNCPALVPSQAKSCWRMCLGPWGKQGTTAFVWWSDWILLPYHGVICLHWFKLFHLDMSSFTKCRFTLAHRRPPPNLPAVSLIYEMPFIWHKCLLWYLPPLSSLHLLQSSLSSVTLQSKSEEYIAQQAIHRLDNLTNMLLSVFLLWSLSLSFSLSVRLSASSSA